MTIHLLPKKAHLFYKHYNEEMEMEKEKEKGQRQWNNNAQIDSQEKHEKIKIHRLL